MGRIGHDAFDWYVANDATYSQVADHYGVTKRAVVAHASKNQWSTRLARLREEARRKADQRMVESMEEMNSRHLRALRAVQGKALEALRTMPLSSAMEAIRAIDLSIKQERVIRGEPGDRTAISVEDVVKREYSRWMDSEEADDGTD